MMKIAHAHTISTVTVRFKTYLSTEAIMREITEISRLDSDYESVTITETKVTRLLPDTHKLFLERESLLRSRL